MLERVQVVVLVALAIVALLAFFAIFVIGVGEVLCDGCSNWGEPVEQNYP